VGFAEELLVGLTVLFGLFVVGLGVSLGDGSLVGLGVSSEAGLSVGLDGSSEAGLSVGLGVSSSRAGLWVGLGVPSGAGLWMGLGVSLGDGLLVGLCRLASWTLGRTGRLVSCTAGYRWDTSIIKRWLVRLKSGLYSRDPS
jgi:hypothetical protein